MKMCLKDMPGYPLATKECEPGARCTVISVKATTKLCGGKCRKYVRYP